MTAARIREAAKVLRDAAENATPGPWEACANGGIDGIEYDTVIGPGDVKCSSYCYGGTSTIEGDRLEADAAYIALMSPPVALALADWLDRFADILPEERKVNRPAYGDLAHALALADTILGGKS